MPEGVNLLSHADSYENWPKEGVTFIDLLPLLEDPSLMTKASTKLQEWAIDHAQVPSLIVGVEARGFLFGMALARDMEIPFIPVRKIGKLPGDVMSATYDTEYSKDTLQVPLRAGKYAGKKVWVVDDIYATGGTLRAVRDLLVSLGIQDIQNVVVHDIGIAQRPENMVVLTEL